jgi:hypothetical protein
LGHFEAVSNELDLLLGFLDDVGAKDLALSSFRPVEWGTALASIKGFKGGHLQTSLVAIVVGKLSEQQAVFLLGSIREDTSSQHVFKDLIYSLCLAPSLRVIGCAEG